MLIIACRRSEEGKGKRVFSLPARAVLRAVPVSLPHLARTRQSLHQVCVCVCLCACMCLHVSQIRPASCKFEGRICMQALKLRELGCVFFVYLELSRQMLHNQSMHLKCINWLLWKRSLVFFNLSRHPFALVTLHFLLL